MNMRKMIIWLFAAVVLGLVGIWVVPPVIGSFYDYDILIKGAAKQRPAGSLEERGGK